MSKQTHPKTVGLFVVAALLLTVAIVLVFGSGKLMQRTMKSVLYFEGSLGGLDVGAPVEFQGVKVGTVSDITLVYDEREQAFRIPVVVDLDEEAAVRVNAVDHTRKRADIQGLVDDGLKARLQNQSMVTGKLKIELGFFPDAPVQPTANDTDYVQIPTLPKTLDALASKFKELPLTEIVEDLHKTINGLAVILDAEETKDFIVNLNQTMAELRGLTAGAREQIPALTDSLNETANAAREALERIELLLDTSSPARYQVTKAMDEISQTARALRIFLESLEQDPGSLLHGKSNQ